ncbi:MAG: lamin tail domain-containing protein [Chloroflexi bacterium]|nr:lamin tail domain-containing protein [Chloroflexota bacterium]
MSSPSSAAKWLLIVTISVVVTVVATAAFVQVFKQDPGRPQLVAARGAPVEATATSAQPQTPAVSADVAAPVAPADVAAPALSAAPTATNENSFSVPVANARVHVTISAVKNAGQRTLEAVVIANQGDQVELTGWTLVAPNGATYVFPSYVLLSNNFVQLYTADGANAPTALFWKQPDAVWKSGDVVTLKNGDQVAATYTVR